LFFLAIPTCLKKDLLEIEARAENSYVHNGKSFYTYVSISIDASCLVSLQYVRDPLAFVYDSYVLRICLPNFRHDPTSAPLKIQCQRSTKTWTGTPICRGSAYIVTFKTKSYSVQTLTRNTNSDNFDRKYDLCQ
jgi:hypothetical protein